MKPSSSDLTRKKLIDAGREIFAEVGYRDATVRAIVHRAGVNQAAINYHFRGKDALYLEVMRQAFSHMELLDDGVNESGEDPEERLKKVIDEIMNLSSAKTLPEQQHRKLLAWEMIEPTGLLEQIEREGPLKHHTQVMDVVRPLVPPNTPEHLVAWAAFWLIGQCSIMKQAQRIIPLLPPQLSQELEQSKPQLTALLTVLALNGLRNMPMTSEDTN